MSEPEEALAQNRHPAPLVPRKSIRDLHSMSSEVLTAAHTRRTSRMSVAGKPSDVFRRLSVVSGNISSSTAASKEDTHVLRANTYQLSPDTAERFNDVATQRLIKDVLESYLDGEIYDKNKCGGFAKTISEVIKSRVRDILSPKKNVNGVTTRYKVICYVLLGENTHQSMQCASRCLLNKEMDGFASASYTKGNLYAIATVYALYAD